MNLKTNGLRRYVVSVLAMVSLFWTSGCATLAHRSSASGQRVNATADCAGHGDTCPWLIGDALLLLPGVVPGVIAFAVDFGTGAWRHDGHADHARPSRDATVANVRE